MFDLIAPVATGNEFFYMIGDNGGDRILMLSLTDSHRLIRLMQLGFWMIPLESLSKNSENFHNPNNLSMSCLVQFKYYHKYHS